MSQAGGKQHHKDEYAPDEQNRASAMLAPVSSSTVGSISKEGSLDLLKICN
jgi:hypothetical protein